MPRLGVLHHDTRRAAGSGLVVKGLQQTRGGGAAEPHRNAEGFGASLCEEKLRELGLVSLEERRQIPPEIRRGCARGARLCPVVPSNSTSDTNSDHKLKRNEFHLSVR